MSERIAMVLKVRQQLQSGGAWLGAARSHLQRTPRGDHLIWGSAMPVSITVAEIEELALAVATAAIVEDAKRIEGNLRVKGAA
jgi:hypothetical protein